MIEDHNLDITEQEYRDLAIPSYSLLSSISKQGIDVLGGAKTNMFQLKFGSLVDDICFEPSVVANKYYRGAPVTITSGNPKKIMDLILSKCDAGSEAELNYYDTEIVAAARKRGVYAKYDDTKVLNTILIDKNENYFRDKINSIGKVHVKDEMYEMAIEAATTLKTNDYTNIYFQDDDSELQTFYQFKTVQKVYGHRVKCMLDCLVVDHKNKVLYPVDLKTGESPADMFDEVFLLHKYYLQGGLYRQALVEIVKKDPDLKGYRVASFDFVYLSKMNVYKPLVFNMPLSLHKASWNGFTDRFGFEHKGLNELLKLYEDWTEGYSMYTKEQNSNRGRVIMNNLIKEEDEG